MSCPIIIRTPLRSKSCSIRIAEFLLEESQFTPYSRVAKAPNFLGKKTPVTPRRGQEQEKNRNRKRHISVGSGGKFIAWSSAAHTYALDKTGDLLGSCLSQVTCRRRSPPGVSYVIAALNNRRNRIVPLLSCPDGTGSDFANY